MADFKVPLIIRGELIDDFSVDFSDRSGSGRSFATADVNHHLAQMICDRPEKLSDLYEVSLNDIYEYLHELGQRLDLDRNPYWREAFEISCQASNLSRPAMEHCYRHCPAIFHRDRVRDVVETRIGAAFLEGWVPSTASDGRVLNVRAVGSRGVHITAGNVPIVSVITIMRSAITRSDTIIKAPSNDPLSASAIARTMIDMAPDHPITRHLTVAYWKGGDEQIERRLYQARNLEKIVAWGGFTSVKHISKYLGPGIDLITLDPKISTTLVGREALIDEETMRYVAMRVAADIGGMDQEACTTSRVFFVETGTDDAGIATANRFGRMIFEAIQVLPRETSGGPNRFDPELKSEIESIMPLKDFYNVVTEPGRIEKTGAIIVSQMDEQVDFPRLLYGRVANLVPLDDIATAISTFTAATQTVGVYPDSLRKRLRDRAALAGGQIFQPVGYAITGSMAAPQDGVEPERRMCRWVVDYDCDPAIVPGPWMTPAEVEVAA